MPVRLIPAEEMIWSKAFVMERERFDGADVAHILRACAETLDWPRLLQRFDGHWRVLLQHLVMFGFIYPSERARIPAAVLRELMSRLERELTRSSPDRVCQGTLISRAQYLVDVERWDYADPRLAPRGNMTHDECVRWTAGIADDGPSGRRRSSTNPAPRSRRAARARHPARRGLLHSSAHHESDSRGRGDHGEDRAVLRARSVRSTRPTARASR